MFCQTNHYHVINRKTPRAGLSVKYKTDNRETRRNPTKRDSATKVLPLEEVMCDLREKTLLSLVPGKEEDRAMPEDVHRDIGRVT